MRRAAGVDARVGVRARIERLPRWVRCDRARRMGCPACRCARACAAAPSPFHNRRKTWAVTKSEICRDSCPDMRIAADFCTEFSLELLRKWSVATKNDETHDNNPSPSGAHRGSRLRRFLASLGFLCHGLFYLVSNAPWAAAASWTPRARPSCTAQTPTGTARPRSPESPPVYPHRFATGSGRLAQPPPR